MIKYRYTKDGRVRFLERHSSESYTDGIIKPDKAQELIFSGVEIAPYVDPVNTTDQLKAEVEQKLKLLDASPRTLSNALLGDQWAIDELKRLEAEKVVLRDKLNSL